MQLRHIHVYNFPSFFLFLFFTPYVCFPAVACALLSFCAAHCVVLCCAFLRFFALCCAMLRFGALCCAMLRYGALRMLRFGALCCVGRGRGLVDCAVAERQVPELPPSSVSSLVWAYAKMGYPSAELMERVVSPWAWVLIIYISCFFRRRFARKKGEKKEARARHG